MSFIRRKLFLGITTATVLMTFMSAQAQDAVVQEGLADFSIEMDEMPPQPVGTTLSEEAPAAPVKAEVTVSEIQSEPAKAKPDITGVPTQPDSKVLTPVPEETVATDAPAAEKAAPVQHSGLYYDSDYIVPSAALAGNAGPREVDPKFEPGSRFVIVRKGAGPESTQARLVAAQRALSLGRYTSALELYEGLYRKEPKNRQILMGLAVAQQQSGFTESAIATYEELLRIDPKNTDATVNMLGLVKSQYPSVAYRKLKDLWDNNRQNAGIAAQLGLTSASVGNMDDAFRYLGIAASLEPNNALHFYNMAVVSDQAGAYKDALDLYERALQLDVTFGDGRAIPRDQVYDRLARLRRL